MRDVDEIIEQIRSLSPAVSVYQIHVTHPGADDDGLWSFASPECPFTVQIESPDGMCPFLMETDEHDRRLTIETVGDVVLHLSQWLHLKDGAA